MQIWAQVRPLTIALATSCVLHPAAGVSLRSVGKAHETFVPPDYQFTPCGHACGPGQFPKGEKWEEPVKEVKAPPVAPPCGCGCEEKPKPLLAKSGCQCQADGCHDVPPNPCGRPEPCARPEPRPCARVVATAPPPVVTTTAPPPGAQPCGVRIGAVVRLVDDKDQLMRDFATFFPPPPSLQASPPPRTQPPLVHSPYIVPPPPPYMQPQPQAPLGEPPPLQSPPPPRERRSPIDQSPFTPVHFQAVGASAAALAPAPAPMMAPAPAALATYFLACRYVPQMDKMLGKNFVVKSINNGCIGITSPDGSQNGVWYFPPTSVKLWEHTADGQAPNVARLARKFMGDPEYADLDIVPPGRYDAPWDYQIKGWSLTKPIAPHVQDAVDFEKTAVRMPPWAKVRQIASVDCMDKMHHDPHYVCDPDSYADNAIRTTLAPDNAGKTYIHTKTRPSSKGQEMTMGDYFRPNEDSLNTAQGTAEQQGQ